MDAKAFSQSRAFRHRVFPLRLLAPGRLVCLLPCWSMRFVKASSNFPRLAQNPIHARLPRCDWIYFPSHRRSTRSILFHHVSQLTLDDDHSPIESPILPVPAEPQLPSLPLR